MGGGGAKAVGGGGGALGGGECKNCGFRTSTINTVYMYMNFKEE